jgi:NAD(P)-dependent dehydrogenase (short-subunit alcohol dehydrogenase family)
MSTILITGANRGLGREAARRLLALDVTDDASVAQAAEEVAAATGGSLDVLINSAGIPGTFADVADVTAADVEAVYAVNVLGPVRTFHAFLPLLRRAAAGWSSTSRAASTRTRSPPTQTASRAASSSPATRHPRPR